MLYKDEATNTLEQPASIRCYVLGRRISMDAVVTPHAAGDHANISKGYYNETMKMINVTLHSAIDQTVTVNIFRHGAQSENSDPSLIFYVSVVDRQATTGKL